jgi:hypothetical protein
MFMFCSYAATEMEADMDNRINELRRTIKALRVSMREAEAIMHEQINRDEDCSFVAQEVIKMRSVMSLLVKERTALGDFEPILVNSFFIPRRRSARRLAAMSAPTVESVFRPRLVARV